MSKVKNKKQSKSNKAAQEEQSNSTTVRSPATSSQTVDIFKIFTEVQWTEAFHDKYVKQLKRIYKNTPFKVFVNDFVNCLKKIFIISDKNLEKCVELSFDFAAKFIVSLNNPESEDTCPFLLEIFKFLILSHDVSNTSVRLHCCQFIACLLTTFGPEGSLDVFLCDNITIAMIERLQDKIAAVRTQAVLALHRLQDPADDSCKIIEVFLYHMVNDPSPEVRSAIVNNIFIVKKTLNAVLTRINDCKEFVRKDAFTVCAKFRMQTFSIKQRQFIFNSGFLDSSDKIKDYVKKTLLPKWFTNYKSDYVHFLRALNVQNELGLEVATKCIKTLFNQTEKIELVDYMVTHLKQKTVPFDKLSPEVVFFWRLLAEFLLPPRDSEKTDEFFEKIVPELSLFTDYIKGYYINYNCSGSTTDDSDDSRVKMDKEFVLMQLLEITKFYDLADEFGRNNLSHLCVYLLKDSSVTVKSVPIIVNRLVWSISDVSERIATIVELISDLREPFFEMDVTTNSSFTEMRSLEATKVQLQERLKVLENEKIEASQNEDLMIAKEIENEIATIESKLTELNRQSMDIPVAECREENIDPAVVTKYLKIINEMIDSRDIVELTPTLRSLFDNVVLPGFKKNLKNATISSLSLETFGMFCLLDPVLARERFIVFCFLISSDSLTVTALKIVFDLLQRYGLKMFHLEENDESDIKDEGNERRSNVSNRTSTENTSGKYIIPLLHSLLDSDTKEIRNVAAEGLCKLLLTGHLRSPKLIAKLISLWFIPVSAEDSVFRQRLGLFFKAFVMTYGAQLILEKAFLPTLQIFFDASPADCLAEVDVDSVVRLLINFTDPEFGTSLPKGYCVHNQLAVKICNELISYSRGNVKERSGVLLKALTQLTIQNDDIDQLKELQDQSETLIHKYRSLGEKTCQRLAMKLNIQLNALIKNAEMKLAESEICNTLNTTHLTEKKSISVTSNNTVSSMDNNPSSSVVSKMDEDVEKVKDEVSEEVFEVTTSTAKVISIDSEGEDSDSSIYSNVKYKRRQKNIKQKDEVNVGITISSSDEDDVDLEDKEDEKAEKKSLTNKHISEKEGGKNQKSMRSSVLVSSSDDNNDAEEESEVKNIQVKSRTDKQKSTKENLRRGNRRTTHSSVVDSLSEDGDDDDDIEDTNNEKEDSASQNKSRTNKRRSVVKEKKQRGSHTVNVISSSSEDVDDDEEEEEEEDEDVEVKTKPRRSKRKVEESSSSNLSSQISSVSSQSDFSSPALRKIPTRQCNTRSTRKK